MSNKLRDMLQKFSSNVAWIYNDAVKGNISSRVAAERTYEEIEKTEQAIEAHYISKADVLKALGEEVEVASIKDLEERVYVIPAQNQLRSQIKKELNL